MRVFRKMDGTPDGHQRAGEAEFSGDHHVLEGGFGYPPQRPQKCQRDGQIELSHPPHVHGRLHPDPQAIWGQMHPTFPQRVSHAQLDVFCIFRRDTIDFE